MKRQLKSLVAGYYSPRLRHRKRRLEVRFLGKGEPELTLLPRVLDRGHVSLDVGANIGDYLNVLARHSRRAIAFEPHPTCFAYLAAAGIGNCTLLNLALSDRAGTAILKVPIESDEVTGLGTIEATNTSFAGAATRVRAGAATRVRDYEVKVERLDDVARAQLRDGERIGFIKIDVEGHEHAVLEGGRATIDAHRPMVMIETEYRHGAPVRAIFDCFAARGYVAKLLLKGRIEDVDAQRLKALQQGIGVGDMVTDAKDSVYVNNVWFVPPERLSSLTGSG